jgi:hypothetical protein
MSEKSHSPEGFAISETMLIEVKCNLKFEKSYIPCPSSETEEKIKQLSSA